MTALETADASKACFNTKHWRSRSCNRLPNSDAFWRSDCNCDWRHWIGVLSDVAALSETLLTSLRFEESMGSADCHPVEFSVETSRSQVADLSSASLSAKAIHCLGDLIESCSSPHCRDAARL